MPSILFVSQNSSLRAAASRVLRKTGWQVAAVAHGGHALLACVEGRRFDVLVVEDRVPEDSAVLARSLRRYCPRMQLVSLRDRHEHARDVSDGVTVVRPCTADDLIGAVLEAAAATAIASA